MAGRHRKTYYSPDKSEKIEIRYENGYRDITVSCDATVLRQFRTAGELVAAREIITASGDVIQVRFLTDSPDFEVFYNGIQVDDSHNSPHRVIAGMYFPIYGSLFWYLITIAIGLIFGDVWSLITYDPTLLFTHIGVVYIFTGSIVVSVLLIYALIGLRKGNLALYYIAFIAVCSDAVFSFIYQVAVFVATRMEMSTAFILTLTFPLMFKAATIAVFYKNMNRYKQIVYQQAQLKQKTNPGLLDAG